MMEPKHTPGPWAVTKEDHRLKVHPAGWQNTVICEWKEGRTGAGRDGTRHHTGNYPPYAEGDARLIAAAPQLLAACQAFVAAWEKSGQLEKTDVALRMARQALAAATGQED